MKDKRFGFILEIFLFITFFFYLLDLRFDISAFVVNPSQYNDFSCYLSMADDITCIFRAEIIEPYIHRVLVPFIAGLLPFDLAINFALIGFISFYLTGVVLYYTLRINFNRILSILGFLFFWLFTFNINLRIIIFHYTILVDPTTYLFFICCFYCILKRKKKLYSFFLVLGVLTKENLLFTIPVFIIYQFLEEKMTFKHRDGFIKFLRICIYIIPAITIFLLLKLLSRPDFISNYPFWYDLYGNNEYGTLGMILALVKERFKDPFNIYDYFLSIWGIILISFCFLEKRAMFNWLKLYGIFMVLVYCQLFLARGIIRHLFIGFYPMIYLSILGFQNLIENYLSYPLISFSKIKIYI